MRARARKILGPTTKAMVDLIDERLNIPAAELC